MKKNLIKSLIIFILSIFVINPILAQELNFPSDEQYTLIDVITKENFQVIQSFSNEKEAIDAYKLKQDFANNLILVYEGRVLKAEYAVIQFVTKERCTYNVEYTNSNDHENGYTNGCYAADAAYLQSNDTLSKVEFMLSGVQGWAKMQDVILTPIEYAPTLSKYQAKSNELFHYLKTSFEHDRYDSAVNLAKSPSYLTENVDYYSYDGHYFYSGKNQTDSYRKMIDDYRRQSKSNAINFNDPYYNYYLYITHRTTSNYSLEEMQNYFTQKLWIQKSVTSFVDLNFDGITDILTRSQYSDQLESFFQYQDEYGANALMMLALSMNETAFGRSSLAFTRNNLFGHAAYDSAVEKNASRYSNIASSVLSHAKNYISNSYLNPKKFQYHGGFFGNKASGMNVSYASDPYWGEKAAQYYYQLDSELGNKDANSYAIGIKIKNQKTKIYRDPSLNAAILYDMPSLSDFGFILLESITNEQGNWYKIQTDPTLNSQRELEAMNYYDFSNNYGFILQQEIELILNPEKMGTKKSYPITLQANGGVFNKDQTVLTLRVQEGLKPSIVPPLKEGEVFIGWDQELVPAKEEKSYIAQYKEVSSIAMSSLPRTKFDENERIEIAGGKIQVTYLDQSTADVDITTSMISGFDMKIAQAQDVYINYGGQSTSYQIEIVAKDLEKLSNMEKQIDELTQITQSSELDPKNLYNLHQQLLEDEVIVLNRTQRKAIDYQLQKALGRRLSIIIEKNDYNLSASGLTLALELAKLKAGKFLPDTLRVKIQSDQNETNSTLLQRLASANNYTYETGFQLRLGYNGNWIDPKDAFIVSIDKPTSDSNRIYTVLYTEGEDVFRLSTTQTDNKIRFETPYVGDFCIVSKISTNIAEQDDYTENNRMDNNGIDYTVVLILLVVISIFIIVGIIVVIKLKNKKSITRKRKGIKHDS